MQEFFIDKIGEDRNGADQSIVEAMKHRATEKLDLMLRYAQTHHCRRQAILEYFGDDSEVNNCACDVCAAAGGDGALCGHQ